MTEKLLKWNKSLTTQGDKNGSTPLHFASSRSPHDWGLLHPSLPWLRHPFHSRRVAMKVFEANPTPVYQPDKCGLFPIHVAASVDARWVITIFLEKCPSSAGLRDAKGRTFLHAAVEKKQVNTVRYACRNPSLTWILNMQDNDGNTALHLAVQAGNLRMFCALLGNRQVHLNLTNKKGQTPRDIARYKIPRGIHYSQNTEAQIYRALEEAGALGGGCRGDRFEENCEDIHQLKSEDESKKLKKVKDTAQTLSIGAVLIATVTFGATFALPGGYRADDHTNGGTPTLAGRYAFDAFMMANTLAFICSSTATVCLMRSGSPAFNPRRRNVYLRIAFYSMETSIICLIVAFTLGVYTVLAPVAYKIAVAICVMSPLVVLCSYMEILINRCLLAPSLCVRNGIISTLTSFATILVANILYGFWPLVLIFGWAAYARNHPI